MGHTGPHDTEGVSDLCGKKITSVVSKMFLTGATMNLSLMLKSYPI